MKILIADGTGVGCARIRTLVGVACDTGVIRTAESPGDLLGSLAEILPDVLIVDPDIAGSDGLPLVRRILRDRPSLQVIVLSNTPGPSYRKHCLRAGVRFFFDKSTEFHLVAQAIGTILGGGADRGPRDPDAGGQPLQQTEGATT